MLPLNSHREWQRRGHHGCTCGEVVEGLYRVQPARRRGVHKRNDADVELGGRSQYVLPACTSEVMRVLAFGRIAGRLTTDEDKFPAGSSGTECIHELPVHARSEPTDIADEWPPKRSEAIRSNS